MTVATGFPEDNNKTLEQIINVYCLVNPDYY